MEQSHAERVKLGRMGGCPTGSGLWPTRAAALAFAATVFGACAAHAQSVEELQQLSISELANVDVSSVSKASQPLSEAPASIYVITHDDIVRSGATSLPEILRLAPNLFVAQTSASNYVITARGFSGSSAAQSYSDKLLVLIDGRSVYTPMFSGVYWDMQQVLPEDIDRIEVISGPGATLWGANAVNGVINIITKKSFETQGGFAEIGGGNLERQASLQYGGRISPDLTWRAYATGFYDADTLTSTGARAHDHWTNPQGGFRLDWTPSAADSFTLQGDAFQGWEAQDGAPDQDINGRNLMGRWNHVWAGGSTLQIQAYYDREGRTTEGADNGSFWVDAYDLDVQDGFDWGSRQKLVIGGGIRLDAYQIIGTPSLQFSPSSRTLDLSNAFVQDVITLTSTTRLTLGLKVEDDPYSGVRPLPDVRLSWTPNDRVMVWSAISRAIRAPTPFDRDVREYSGPTLFISAADFQPETLTAYEAGVRLQPTSRATLSIQGFYNVYDNLRSVDAAPVGFLPLTWGNSLQGDSYGMEAWGSYQMLPWWRMMAGLDLLSEHLRFAPGAAPLLPASQDGDDPSRQATLRSSMNLGPKVTFDADLRYVGVLPDPHIPSYVELNGRIGWTLTPRLELAVAAFNLLHDHHQEFPGPAGQVPRSVFAELKARF